MRMIKAYECVYNNHYQTRIAQSEHNVSPFATVEAVAN